MRLIDLWPLPIFTQIRVVRVQGVLIVERKRWWLPVWLRTGPRTEKLWLEITKGKTQLIYSARNAAARRIGTIAYDIV